MTWPSFASGTDFALPVRPTGVRTRERLFRRTSRQSPGAAVRRPQASICQDPRRRGQSSSHEQRIPADGGFLTMPERNVESPAPANGHCHTAEPGGQLDSGYCRYELAVLVTGVSLMRRHADSTRVCRYGQVASRATAWIAYHRSPPVSTYRNGTNGIRPKIPHDSFPTIPKSGRSAARSIHISTTATG
jgi:hypothetical protein